jgi:ABC-type phosphate transport system substrate-binding protein
MKRLILVFGLLLAISAIGFSQIAVIANPSVEEYTIDRPLFVKIYTLSSTKWSNEASIVAFDLKTDNPVRAKMLDFISKEPLELRRIWLKAVASGSAKAPDALATEEEVVEKVASTPGAIGYVSASKVGKGVKVLMRFGK